VRAASAGFAPVNHAIIRRRRRRKLLIGGVIVLVVGLVAALFVWQSVERQSREQRRAVTLKVAEAKAADAALRKAVEPLPALIADARATRDEVADVLGDASSAVATLDDALEVASTFLRNVNSNPRDVEPETMTAAIAALREDQDQLALVPPVLSNIENAQKTAKRIADQRLLLRALDRLERQKQLLGSGISTATALKDRVDARIAELAALPTPEPTPSATKKSKKAKKADPVYRTEAQTAELAELQEVSTQLAQGISAAQSALDATVDRADLDAVEAGVKALQQARKNLRQLQENLQEQYPALAALEADQADDEAAAGEEAAAG
jgi:hypothetical protein